MTVKLFISYYSDDSSKKNSLKRAILKRTGIVPIVVEDYRLNGIEFTEKVKNDLRSADYFIPIITVNSYKKSQWLNQEIGYAFAIFAKDKIYPIVQESIIPKLKGFIHDKAEISYNYIANRNDPKKERASFRKCIYSLLDDIQKKEKLDLATGLNFESLIKTDYKDSEIPLNILINNNLKLFVRIKLTNKDQEYRFYYLVITDRNEKIWIGFTNAQISDTGYITKGENTQRYSNIKGNELSITDNVSDTILSRIAMMRGTSNAIKGNPVLIKILRFRGDKISNEPIHYHYAFQT